MESNRLIHIEACFKGRVINLTFVYGDPILKNCDLVWEWLIRIGITRSTPWFLIGDFHELTGNHEKWGGRLRSASSFLAFNGMIRDCGLLDFPFLGDCLSWRGWRDKKPIQCRLDRALDNEDWHDLFPDTVTEYLPMIASDHIPLVTSIGAKRPRGRRSFMFDRRWVGKAGLMEAISSGWNADHDPGSSGFVDKIVSCRRAISRWRKTQIPFGRDLIEELKRKLEVAQADDASTPELISDLSSQLLAAYRDEEIHWYQKSRNRWMRDVWSTDDGDICDMEVSYFEDLFTSINPDNFEEVLREVNMVITDADNTRLTAPATEVEIRKALFMMHPDKAPGPDGMTALFFQKAWTVVKTDLVSMVNQFLEEGDFEKGLNRTHICLIPKVVKPTRMTELRPIKTQTAFVPGRLISDNILIAQEMFHGLRTNRSCRGKFMAIKTDMSKAYDRVEWGFLKAMFRKMGFSERWISWIMFCVSSVEYRVLLNGQPNGLIVPERGLRQGDPLSPYLFILCTEVLIANIQKAEAVKRIMGIKVANKCPPITHLLFADDGLFFCKVDKDQCMAILEILRHHTVDAGVQAEIQGVLGITNLGGMGSYLGIPESLGGSKTKVFSYVRDCLQSRTTGWSARLLSKGGKEVMVKSVATAVPTFVMSCYRLPKTITSKLTSVVANFWWSTNGQSGGMHWIAWEQLCCSKQLGGLGFKSIDDFNTALLAKQLWRLLEYPNSLFARVFKSRYYRNSDPLDPIRSYSPSYGWRSIVSACSLVNKGLITRVGSGSSISIWSDPWVPAQFPRPALSNGPFKDPNLRLPYLIDRRTRSWRKDLLTQHFDPLDVALIEAIPLGSDIKDDCLGWHFTKTGKYTVKYGYETARRDVQGPFRALGSGPEITPFIVWALANVPVGPQHFPMESVYTNLDHFLDPNGPGSHITAFPWLMWYLWKARNARVFENLDERPDVVVRVAESEAVTWQKAQVDVEGDEITSIPPRPSSGPRLGISLPQDFTGYRCYVDGSWKETDVFAGAGWCCISSQNTPPVLGATNFR
ncbi:PREDICTED: uncharacterized protein LOC109128743 [Camelina sativa]|uniref:Uncharacterized protein LOC109128743 n=1 Tax=Camelina sativa TaxID=90675 RepID=A0ABM1QWM1_CAMSA|nr:PREDICTED: uncharacterized protein LOC109128743 [Camelina sativa]